MSLDQRQRYNCLGSAYCNDDDYRNQNICMKMDELYEAWYECPSIGFLDLLEQRADYFKYRDELIQAVVGEWLYLNDYYDTTIA